MRPRTDFPLPKEDPPARGIDPGGPRHVMRRLSSAEGRAIDVVTSSPKRRSRVQNEPPLGELVFDDLVIGTATVYTDTAWNVFLGAWDRYALQAVADQVAGDAPTLSVEIETSSDGRNWLGKNASAEIAAAALTVGGSSVHAGFDAGRPGFERGRLRITLGGFNPVAHLKVWVVPRTML